MRFLSASALAWVVVTALPGCDTGDEPATDTGDDTATDAGVVADADSPLPDFTPPDDDELTDVPLGLLGVNIGATAVVTVGTIEYEFDGVSALAWYEWEENGHTIPPDAYDGSCSFLRGSDDTITTTISFQRRQDRNLHNSFSMADLGDGTVVWGLHDPGLEKEFSATGPGITALSGQVQEAGFITIVVEFSGLAVDNFDPSDQRNVTSKVYCLFLPR